MKLQEMKYIVEIAKHNSLSETARRLFIPQPTLSNALRRVESEINKNLFVRTSDGMALTANGEKFVQLAQNIIEMSENICDEMNPYSDGKKIIKIGLSNDWGYYFLPLVLPKLHGILPHVIIEVIINSIHELSEMIRREEIDLAVIPNPKNLKGLETEIICEERLMLATPRLNTDNVKYVDNSAGNLYFPLSKLAGKEFILPFTGNIIKEYVIYALKTNSIPYRVAFFGSSVLMAKQFVSQGLCYGFVPSTFAKEETQYNISYYLVKEMMPGWPITLVMKESDDEERDSILSAIKGVLKEVILENQKRK